MDTAWFAVDRDGHVAVFESGEAGAVPTVAHLGEDYWDMLDALRQHLRRSTAVHDFEGWKDTAPSAHVAPRDGFDTYDALMFLRSLDEVRDLIERIEAREVPATTGVGLLVSNVDRTTFMAFHERGVCLGCFSHFEHEENWSVAEVGVFEYDHATDNWISGPYALLRRPEKPVTVGEIPRSIAEKAIRFDGRFVDTPRLQPVEFWRCQSWQTSWLGSDMKTVRPFPGKEEEHAKEREETGKNESSRLIFVDSADPMPEATLVVASGQTQKS
jgi:hypothetical protein